ncbi:macrophage mannose receptor 1 isoform X2 [Hydra vulgaris]|uniref:macrophage mannose receptor 1 isoform X2 n=1 Tax=Hydra vulgaris TaxID=6087 RepID=UPI001F5FBFB9|nr:macrophage mannose receptor 1 isoform X2 [Hydra vulgaris]
MNFNRLIAVLLWRCYFHSKTFAAILPSLMWDPRNYLFSCENLTLKVRTDDRIFLICPKADLNTLQLDQTPNAVDLFEKIYLLNEDQFLNYETCNTSCTSEQTKSKLNQSIGGSCRGNPLKRLFTLKLKIYVCTTNEVENKTCNVCQTVSCYEKGCGKWLYQSDSLISNHIWNGSHCLRKLPRQCISSYFQCDGLPYSYEVEKNKEACKLGSEGTGEWTNFGPCTKSCGGGISVRTRSCPKLLTSNGGNDCSESTQETKSCASDPCPIKCSIGWLEYGGYCYLFNTATATLHGKNWKDSLLSCLSYGGNLLSVTDQAENLFIVNQLKNDNMGNNHYWIGLSELKNERIFIWSDSTALVFSNWKANEPNNHKNNNEECVQATVDGWNDNVCSGLFGFICKVKQGNVGICANDWLEYGNHCYLFNTINGTLQGKNWKDSSTTCQSYGGSLLSVTDRAENLFILNQLKNDNMKNKRYWIGLHELKNERKFTWSDSTALLFSNWKANEPSNQMNEDCVELTIDGWNDISCNSLLGFICKVKQGNGGKCLYSWLKYGSHCYLFNTVTGRFQGKNWKDSLSTCQSFGGTLLGVTDQEENLFILNQLKNDNMKNNHYWIGLNALQNQRKFMWSDSTSLLFSNWKANEPNNQRNNNDECVETNADGWNDSNCNSLFGFICKFSKA